MVGCCADGLVSALNQNVHHGGGLMMERAGDGAVARRCWLERRAVVDGQDASLTFDPAFRNGDLYGAS